MAPSVQVCTSPAEYPCWLSYEVTFSQSFPSSKFARGERDGTLPPAVNMSKLVTTKKGTPGETSRPRSYKVQKKATAEQLITPCLFRHVSIPTERRECSDDNFGPEVFYLASCSVHCYRGVWFSKKHPGQGVRRTSEYIHCKLKDQLGLSNKAGTFHKVISARRQKTSRCSGSVASFTPTYRKETNTWSTAG